MAKGKFIVFEGLDGAGSSTQLKLLFAYLKKRKYPVLLTTNPSDSQIGKLIRNILSGKNVSGKAVQFLYCADREDNLEKVILPALKKGKIVICDRYYYSTIAYGMLDAEKNWLMQLTKDFLRPDITFFVHTPTSEAMKRMVKRTKKEHFEKEKFLKKVEKNYLDLMKKDKICVILDGTDTREKIFEDVLAVLKKKKIILKNE